MELIFKDYQFNNEFLNFTIKGEVFNGITGKEKDNLLSIIKLPRHYKGQIIIDQEELTKENITKYQKKIDIIKEEIEYAPFTENVYQLLAYEIRKKNLILKDAEKKIRDSLKIVELDSELLERNIHSLSSSEQKFLQIAISLLSNPDLIILEEPFRNLDIKNEKKVMSLLQKIKELYHKTIIFVSNDTNMLYKYTSHLVIFKNSKIIAEGNTNEIFQRVDFLKRNKISIPQIVEFTYTAKKKKKVKLDYHKDIRDIIKDIYKHV